MQIFKSIGHDEAFRAVEAIKAALLENDHSAVIAVASAHGELIALLCLDGAKQASIKIAANKAWSAARERVDSWELGKSARNPESGFDMAYFGDDRYIGWGGGIPVKVDEITLGAVAVSGLTEELDQQYAHIGVGAIRESLA